MRYFPIFLDLKGKTALVVGGGEEAVRKVRLLLKTGARIIVVAEELHSELLAEPRVQWSSQAFNAGHLANAALVISAESRLNAEVSAAAQARGIPVNAVDAPELSTFIVPSIVDRDPVVVAIGTEGTAPVLGQSLRARIDALLPHGLGSLARAAGALRERVAATLPHGSRRRTFWQSYFFGPAREAFLSGETNAYTQGVEAALAASAALQAGRISLLVAASDDPEQLTIKAHRRLMEADVILHDQTVSPRILELSRRDAVRMKLGASVRERRRIGDTLSRHIHDGQLAVMLSKSLTETLQLCRTLAASGIAAELIATEPVSTSAGIVPFPDRTDLSDAVLRAAS